MSSGLLSQIKTHSTIVIGDENFYPLLDEIKNLTSDYLSLEKIIDIDPKKSVKNLLADDVIEMQDFLKTKTSTNRYIITNRNIRNTTLQNRILKLLEEGGENTFVILVLDTIDYLLPTVLSRCQVMEEYTQHPPLTPPFDRDGNNTKIKNIFTNVKEKLIKSKNFVELEKILQLELAYNMGTISEVNVRDYIGII